LWIARINSASRAAGVSYSKFVNGLSQNNIKLDRKTLSEIAIKDYPTFEAILKKATS
jgi:large subunit ribosomal protein L20